MDIDRLKIALSDATKMKDNAGFLFLLDTVKDFIEELELEQEYIATRLNGGNSAMTAKIIMELDKAILGLLDSVHYLDAARLIEVRQGLVA